MSLRGPGCLGPSALLDGGSCTLLRFDELKSGHGFDPLRFTVTAEDAAAYVAATGDESPIAADRVPPMAIIAKGLSHMIESLGLGGGTIHASQEVAFQQPVSPGQALRVETSVRANAVRRSSRFLTVESSFLDEASRPVARSVSTVIVPA